MCDVPLNCGPKDQLVEANPPKICPSKSLMKTTDGPLSIILPMRLKNNQVKGKLTLKRKKCKP